MFYNPLIPLSKDAMREHWRHWAQHNARRVRGLTDQAWQAAAVGPAEGRLGRAATILAERLCAALVAR